MLSDDDVKKLMPLARSFAAMPDHQNPIRNAAARDRLPPDMQPHIDAIASHATLSAAANGSGAIVSMSPTSPIVKETPIMQDSLAANQTAIAKRLPDVRHNVVGMAALVFAGAGTAKGVFTPQVRFKPNRLVIPSNTLAGTTIGNMLVGTRPQYAADSTEPFHMFEEQSTSGMWDMDPCEIGQTCSLQATVTGATTVFACLIGEALDGKPYTMLRSPLKRISKITAGIGAGATVSIAITPQVRFKTRKLVVDDSTAANFVINSFNVGITPQFMSADPSPAGAFSEVSQDTWLDCDEAYIGNQITLNVTNTSAGALAFGASLLGDVDPRDLQGGYHGF